MPSRSTCLSFLLAAACAAAFVACDHAGKAKTGPRNDGTAGPTARSSWSIASSSVTSSSSSSVTTTSSSSSWSSARLRSQVNCTPDASFPASFALPEASAAAEVELTPGVREILVVSDSGNHGAALAWRLPSGPVRSLTLPLDAAASDDIEGMAWLRDRARPGDRQGALYTLTSSGAVRRFVPDGHGGLRRDQDAYAIGGAPWACGDLGAVNCGKNYEGLCLRPRSAPGRCAGYAASKRASQLVCLDFAGDRLAVDTVHRPIALDLAAPFGAHDGVLSDCAFGADPGPAQATLLITTNVYGGSSTYVVNESTGAPLSLDMGGTMSNEAVAVDRDGALYQFLDDNGAASAGLRATCRGW